KMADVNAPFDQTPTMAPPVRADDQILLHISAKGTKREIFGMPIPGRLITKNIREASYYQEYQENVAKHRGFLAGKTGSTQDLHAPKPTKLARKPQSTARKAPSKPSISSPPRRSPKSVGASEAEEVPAEEPQVADEDADYQKAVEESMKDAYALPKGPLPLVVIREPESGKYQLLPEVPGKGKAKVTEEQVAHDLLSLQKHKKTSPADQYIFQRRVSEPTASSFHDESPYEVLGQLDSEEESEKIVLEVEKGGQDEGQAGPDPDAQAGGQAGSNPDETSEGQAGSDLDETSEGQARPDPGNAEARVQSTSSPVVYAGSDRDHMDLDVANVSPQPSTEQLEEGFTATVYPNVQENLKLAIEEPVLPESPKEHQQLKATTTDTTTITTTTLPPPQAPQQSTTEAMMVKRIDELEHILADLIQVNKTMEERLEKHGARLYRLEQLDIPQQVSIAVSEVVMDAVDWAMQALLRNRFRDLPEADMKEILHRRMWESDSYKSHGDHTQLFEALKKSMNRDHSEELTHDLAEARKKRKKGRESPKTPPGSPSHQPLPPPPPAAPSRTPSKTASTTKHQAWTTPDVTLKPLISLTPEDLDMDEAMGPDEQAQLSDEEDIGSAHIPTVNLRQGWWKPFEEERTTTPEPAWSIRSSDVPVPTNNWASALASNYSPPPEDSL
nr:E-beta-farnesene synthase [Tanacetum cinerariifolium]